MANNQKRIVFDIETAGEDFDQMDENTQHALTRWLKRSTKSDEAYQAALEDLKQELGFSPFTGRIVAIGVLDADSKKGAVYFDLGDEDKNEKFEELEEDGLKYKAMDEKAMIEQFWQVAAHAGTFVSFNGRSFDVPYILVRGAVHEVRPTKNLMANRYLNSQPFGSKHVDLLDQLSFYGAVFKRPNLHVVCRAFGIKSPKEDGVTGDEVSELFKKGEGLEIAKYNGRDLFSTREVFEKWERFLK